MEDDVVDFTKPLYTDEEREQIIEEYLLHSNRPREMVERMLGKIALSGTEITLGNGTVVKFR